MSSGCVCLTSLGSIRDLRPRRLEHRICLLGSSALKRECLLDPRQPILEAAYFGVGLETKSRLTLCRYGGEGSVGGDERWSQGRRESGGRNKEDSSLCFSCTHGIIREPALAAHLQFFLHGWNHLPSRPLLVESFLSHHRPRLDLQPPSRTPRHEGRRDWVSPLAKRRHGLLPRAALPLHDTRNLARVGPTRPEVQHTCHSLTTHLPRDGEAMKRW